MKRYIKSTKYNLCSTEVRTYDEIKSEIQKAIDAGVDYTDVDDYLNQLYTLKIIDDEGFSELINWAAKQLPELL